jgi:hypothetical protein
VTSAAATHSLLASLRAVSDGSIAAELVVLNSGGRRSLRRLTAPSCAEAVEALALVIAITLDPASVTEGEAHSTEARSDRGTSKRSADAAKSDAARAGEQETRAAISESDGASEARVEWQGGAAVVAVLGPAPSLMPGLALALGVAWEQASLWSPALRLTAAHHWLSGVSESNGSADFQLDSGSLELCPLRLGVRRIGVRACANAQAGRLFARGTRTFSPRSRSRPFVVLGASTLLSISLPARISANAGISAGRTLVQDDFAFAPEVFYRVPWLSLGFGLGLSLGFR